MLHQLKVFARFFIFSLFSLQMTQSATLAHAAQSVGGAMVSPAGQVAATPISIPRPIRLEKMMHIPDVQHPNTALNMSQTPAPGTFNEAIEACELVALHGKEMTLRFHYRISPARPQPIFAGAFLYDNSLQPIDAGYKPVAIAAPGGSVDVVMVLPDRDFQSEYVVTFLMESGQPVFVNGRFKMAYSWQAGTLNGPSLAHIDVAGAATSQAASEPQSNTVFCEEYAQTAVAQYSYAITNNLPGIVPPVWSDNYAGHYNWCLGVPRENATQGKALRQGHLERYKKAESGSSQGQPVSVKAGAATMPALGKAMVVKPVATKQLDPGLGP